MSQKDREMMHESFMLYDTVGDNKIDVNLLGEVLRGLGLNPTEGDVQKIVTEITSTGSRRMTYEEFLPVYESLSTRNDGKKKKTAIDFLECFRVFDREQNGTISIGELQHIMGNLGEGMSADELSGITGGLEDTNGMINIEEFVRTVMSG